MSETNSISILGATEEQAASKVNKQKVNKQRFQKEKKNKRNFLTNFLGTTSYCVIQLYGKCKFHVIDPMYFSRFYGQHDHV